MKKKYQKPEVKKVRLAPEEAVLTACKVTMDAAGGSNKCRENLCQQKVSGS